MQRVEQTPIDLEALLLFGSRARGDHSPSSDIDLLAITDTAEPTVSGSKSASMYQYNRKWLQQKCADGDLFLWHVVSEATPVYDPADLLGELRQNFQLSKNYQDKVEHASDVAWMMLSARPELAPATANRWLAWSVRTISIAKAAQQKIPAFSSAALAEALGWPLIVKLIGQKDVDHLEDAIAPILLDFLVHFGTPKPSLIEENLENFEELFRRTKNAVGLSVISNAGADSGYV